MIRGIFAVSQNGIIGVNGHLPWKLPNDLKYFRRLTEWNTVVMGRKTFESLGSQPLPNRRNIVLSKSGEVPSLLTPELTGMRSVEEVLEFYKPKEHGDLWVIGGNEIFEAFKPFVEEWYITVVEHYIPTFEDMTKAPTLGTFEWLWRLQESHEADEENPYKHRMFKLTRKTVTEKITPMYSKSPHTRRKG